MYARRVQKKKKIRRTSTSPIAASTIRHQRRGRRGRAVVCRGKVTRYLTPNITLSYANITLSYDVEKAENYHYPPDRGEKGGIGRFGRIVGTDESPVRA